MLFCDIANSTARATLLDPEEWADEMRRFQIFCARIVAAHHGHLSDFLGDGVLALFGHPFAGECDAQHALRAGLEMAARAPLDIRVGIATGIVVVSQNMIGGEMIFGEAPNLAARLQTFARPNTVVAAMRTRHLAREHFAFGDLGEHAVRGFARPLQLWRALHEINGGGDFAIRAENNYAGGELKIIGRARELKLLRAWHAHAMRGGARIAHVSGAAGIGKSRLLRAFANGMRASVVLRFICAARDDGGGFIDGGVRDGVGEYASPGLSKLHHPLHSLAELAARLSKLQPVSLLVEDLHRADAGMLESIGKLVARARNLHLFVVFTSRSGFIPPWPREWVVNLSLQKLRGAESARLTENIFGARESLLQSTWQKLIRDCGGVPLLIEEICENLLQARETKINIPDTLHDFLNARLDRLGAVKHFACLAAVCGDEFRYSLVSRIAAQNGIDAAAGMNALLNAGLLSRRADICEDRYYFHPAVFREAAYCALLKKNRRRHHLQISETSPPHAARRRSLIPPRYRNFTRAKKHRA